MNYLSVCSGIEAATVAWHDLGWNPVGFGEIEPFPAAVLKHHYPEVPNFGDMTKFKEWELGTDRLDLLVGGTPCQSFSVAGLRKGLDDPRGNLALVYCSMLDYFRPKWFVWENVPGVLSSNGGRDFGSFLGAVAELGYGFSYRVLDAQYFGVAQRRRRVFVVGHLGNWEPTAAVLFEQQSLCRDTAPRREKGQEVAGTIAARFGISRNNHEECVAQTLQARMGKGGFDLETETPVIAKCLITKTRLDAETETLVPSYGIPGNWIGRAPENGGNAVEPMHDIAPCLTKTDRHGVAQPIGFGWQESIKFSALDNISNTLTKSQTQAVAQPMGFDAYNNDVTGDVSKTIDTGQDYHHVPNLWQGMAVRRLTPTECERLQGFPDNYTNIPWKKSEHSPDGPRYKALGNSMAVPVMKWIGQRIEMVNEIIKE
jgi:DNA (cytosine-5)-methyltransferase 1